MSGPALAAPIDPTTVETAAPSETSVPTTSVDLSGSSSASESSQPEESSATPPPASSETAQSTASPSSAPIEGAAAKPSASNQKAPAEKKAEDQPSLLAVGPDGTSAPYVHWNVVDTDGKPVAGATFKIEYRSWNQWVGKKDVTDCTAANCSVIDRDSDSGEFLAKWIGSEKPGLDPGGLTIDPSTRYRITGTNAPEGYRWVSKELSVDSNSRSWEGPRSNQTLNFGTFTVQKVNNAPVCRAGYIYGITANGQIRAIDPNGQVTNLGDPTFNSGGSMNGLGIGASGSSVFAYLRSDGGWNKNSQAEIYRFDTSTGHWSSTKKSVNSNTDGGTVQFVGGAVNLDTGRYLLGGFGAQGTAQVFRIWEYDPDGGMPLYKGHIETGGSGTANGDMAFDSNGNLFVVRGTGKSTTVFSVIAKDLVSASGGKIKVAKSESFTTMDDVNGVAFDASGMGFLGATSDLRRYITPNWTWDANVTDALGKSTDLASCGSPPTITIEKYVEGGRVAATDQFNLSLRLGSAGDELGKTTTTGNENGLQEERVGPLPTVRNVALHFSETAAGTTNMANYASSYRCLVDGEQTVQGNGTIGSITIPANGQAVECRFYNSPLIAQVNVHKQITDSKGQNPEPGANWSVGATAEATKGTIKSAPASALQQTNAAGTASWKFAFGGRDHTADLSVQELMQDGYSFKEGACTVTALDGTSKQTALSGASKNPRVALVPGDVVDCTFVNSLKPAKVTLGKQLKDVAGQNPKPAAGWTVGAALEPGSTAGVLISTPETAKTVANGKVEKPWIVDFPTKPGARAQVKVQETMQDGYDFVSGTCQVTAVNGTIREQPLNAVSGVLTGLAPGESADCTFTNKPKPGAITWEKIDAKGSALRGSEWELTGPGSTSAATTITDCVAVDAGKCAGPDKDPKAGGFQLTGLAWGTYTLVETKAPAGFVLDETAYTFTVGAKAPAQIVWDLGKITNEQREGLELPLTGGTGTQTFLFGGGAVLLAALGVVAWRRKTTASKN